MTSLADSISSAPLCSIVVQQMPHIVVPTRTPLHRHLYTSDLGFLLSLILPRRTTVHTRGIAGLRLRPVLEAALMDIIATRSLAPNALLLLEAREADRAVVCDWLAVAVIESVRCNIGW